MENKEKTEPPKKEPPRLKMQNIITLTARLAQVLAQEVDLLAALRVADIKQLQPEKLFLVNALEAQRRLIAKNPGILETISPQEKRELKQMVDVFNGVLAENYRRLMVAKEVNHKIVQAITAVVTKHTRRMAYNGKGTTGSAPFEILSVTLNERI